MKRILIMTFLSILVAASWALAAEVFTPTVERPESESFVGYVPNRIVVKFDQSTTRKMNRGAHAQGKTGVKALDDLGTQHGVTSIESQFPGAKSKKYKGRVIDLTGWHKVRFLDEVDVLDVVERYKEMPGVIDAQPISIHTVYREPMEQFYDLQWHLPRIKAPEAWNVETGNSNIVVAILDTGVRYFQKDLGGVDASYFNPSAAEGNMWVNWSEKNGEDGVDDDGNGYVDDWIGWDFVEYRDYGLLYPCYPGEDCSVPDNDPRDFNGHGTHCAGSVAAMNNNNEAVASVAGGWGNGGLESTGNGVKIMPLRIGWSIALLGLPDYEVGVVEMDYAAEALYYAADNGAKIASCSWGSEDTGGLGAAIDYFLASGGLIFKAAGNEESSIPDYMGSRDDIISVAATDEADCKASFSNYGDWVDIAAPGVYIWSLFHDHTDPATDYVAPLDGTSMAAPLAASVAALIWSQEPGSSAEQVKEMLYLSADPIDGLSCNSMYPGELGAGRINAYQAVYHLPTADFSADSTCGYDSLTVNFNDESTGNVSSWSWDFDNDGIVDSFDQNPTYTYSAPGTYTVKLTVSGPYGSDDEIKVDFINVNMTGADLNMEVGEVSDLTHNWKEVSFSRCFLDPVVVAKPLSYNGSDPAVVRMRNVNGRGFEIRLQEWDYLDGGHISETVNYVVMERGSHILHDGTQVEAGSFMTNLTSSFGTFSFNQSFRVVPVLMAAVASFNEGDAVTDRLRNITTGGFDFRMQEQGASVQSHAVETINYIAWEPGLGTANALNFEVVRTENVVTDQFYAISFSSTFQQAPTFLADMQTTYGEDTAAMRWRNRDAYGIEVKIEEDQSFDEETVHITEVVGYMAFSVTGPGAPPAADFSVTYICGAEPLRVNFTDLSDGTIDSWTWDFDNDGIVDSFDQNPTYTYSAPGTYTVKLTVSGPYGSDAEVKVDFINVNVPGAEPNIVEIGEVINLTHNWKEVSFSRCFVDPVVVAKPLSYNGSDPAVVRMRNVNGRGFEIRAQEWDYLDGQHTLAETVNYVVMERGSHILDDGTQVEAGSFMTNLTSSFGTFSFNQSFQVVPVLMAAVASFNEGDAVTDRLRNITTGGFDFRMQEQGANVQSHAVETINYIAWEPGLGTDNGLNFEVVRTGNVVTDQFYAISFSSTFQQAPRFLADMQTTYGEDTAAMRWRNRSPQGVEVKVEEDQSFDEETVHITEVVGYMAFSTASVQ